MNRDRLMVSELKTNELYKGVDDQKLYRRLESKKLEKLEAGVWVEVKITSNLLQEAEFIPAHNKPKRNRNKK